MEETTRDFSRQFYGQAEFPQPYIWAVGYVTSVGAKDSTRFFFPNGVTVSETSTGVYKIVHKIGYSDRYLIIPTPIAGVRVSLTVANINDDDVEVRAFDDSGAAASCAFCFTIYTF